MIQIVKCENCGGENIELGAVSVYVQLLRSNWCDHCHHTNERKQNYFFCSLKCFHNYMNKVSIEEIPPLKWRD